MNIDQLNQRLLNFNRRAALILEALEKGTTLEDHQEETSRLEERVERESFTSPKVESPKINLYTEFLDYCHSDEICGEEVRPIIGEDDTCLLLLAACASGISTVIEGESRSGKSLIMDRVARLLPSTYRLAGCSNKALLNKNTINRINDCDYLIISEIQGVLEGNPDVKEIFKHLSENRPYVYESVGKKGTLRGDITILSTGADENKRTQSREVELNGRFLHLRTKTNDSEKIVRIARYQDRIKAGDIERVIFSRKRFETLKRAVHHVAKSPNNGCEDPFAVFFGSEYLPNTKKSIHCRTTYFQIVDGFTFLNQAKRERTEEGRTLTTIEDVALAHKLFHQIYCRTLRELATQTYNILTKSNSLTEDERLTFREEYEAELREIEDKSKKPVDWQGVWDSGKESVSRRRSALYKRWLEHQVEGSEVRAYDHSIRAKANLCYAGEVQDV